MVNIPIILGDCSCFSFEKLPHICWKDKKLYLVAEKRYHQKIIDGCMETIFNHEVIHFVIAELEGVIVSKKFDGIFIIEREILEELDKCRMDYGILVDENGCPRFI